MHFQPGETSAYANILRGEKAETLNQTPDKNSTGPKLDS